MTDTYGEVPHPTNAVPIAEVDNAVPASANMAEAGNEDAVSSETKTGVIDIVSARELR